MIFMIGTESKTMENFRRALDKLEKVYTSKWLARSQVTIQWSVALKESVNCGLAFIVPTCTNEDRILSLGRASFSIAAAGCGTASMIPHPLRYKFILGNIASIGAYALCKPDSDNILLLATHTYAARSSLY
jgi:hypothetical protein